ncbi:hypothetical protein JL721_6160 [Aureococcus anophagefferens]|nr:hypothetical protein JL721_6160 [Aureococcus anophagefferens]
MTGSQVAKAALKKRDAKLAEERKAARASRKQAAQPPSGIADHVYGVTWVDAPLAAEAAAAVEGFWVLLDDGTGVAQELAAKMTGATAAILPPAPAGATLEQEKARAARWRRAARASRASCRRVARVRRRGAPRARRGLKPTPATKLRVWHLAGVVDDGAAPALTWDRFADVLKPKVDGSLHLHAASLKTPVDTFVLFSSIYGLLGSRELTHYGAAKRSRTAWPPRRRGPRPSPRRGARRSRAGRSATRPCFPRTGPSTRSAAAPRARTRSPDASRPRPPRPPRPRPPRASSGSSRRPPADRAAMLASRVAAHVADMMGVDAASLDRDEPVTAIGLSSMHTVEMVNFLNEELDEDFSPTMVFEHVSIGGVCAHVVSGSSSAAAPGRGRLGPLLELAAAPAAARRACSRRASAHVADMMGVDAASSTATSP